jgi:hypothetical protein
MGIVWLEIGQWVAALFAGFVIGVALMAYKH